MTAHVVLSPGNLGPVNDGERQVLAFLADSLPETFELHPNLQIAVGRGDLVECDMVVFGPDCMWIVEVKDLAGDVVIGEHQFSVNGEPRSHPVIATRTKAQKIKSRLAIDRALGGIWIQPLVVLARDPASLQIDSKMASFVVSRSRAAQLLADPTLIGLLAGRFPARQRAEALASLHLGASVRRPRARFGPYLTDDLLAHGGGRQWWSAHHDVLDNQVLLEVAEISPLLAPNDQQRLRADVLKAAKLGQAVGPHPNLLMPETAFNADDGSVVVVHPRSPFPTLSQLGEGLATMDEESKRRVLVGVARAISACHARGVVHRTIGPSVIHASPTGFARLTGFTRAHREATVGQTATKVDWGSLGGDFWAAPEHLGGEVGRPADLYALGNLIRMLWPSGAPVGIAEIAETLMNNAPLERTPSAAAVGALAAAQVAQPLPSVQHSALIAGSLLGDRYLLEAQIGGGSTAVVWKATDIISNQAVAVKVFDSPDAAQQTSQEYTALLDASHPGIVRVRDGSKIGGRWVLVTELLAGTNLRLAMPPLAPLKPLGEAIPIALRILDALRAVHPNMIEIRRLVSKGILGGSDRLMLNLLRSRGISHRDVKPENIVIVPGRGPVLVDFGLASTIDGGAVGGTFAYRPPDVAPDHADPEIDLFAVGVILHELLTGKHPFTGRDPVEGKLLIDGALSPGIRTVLEQACSVRYDERFGSAQEFMGALAALGIEETPFQNPPVDIVSQLQAIEQALIDRRWHEALEMCPAEWDAVRERITSRMALDREAARCDPVLQIEGFSLVPVGSQRFESAANTANFEVGPGTVRRYLVSGQGGEVIEVCDFASDDGDRWVQAGDVFQTPLPLKRLGGGLRIGSSALAGALCFELRQARISDEKGWSNAFGATAEQLSEGGGVDIHDTLTQFGVVGFGSRADLIGDTSSRRNSMCMTILPDNEHAPAVAYFLTRVMPLVRGVRSA